ncbi:Hypothetical protein A7982_10758 [Minicystis rosea]|nr:Hypothetical protein A7982_10758 [Minicystis rosea]
MIERNDNHALNILPARERPLAEALGLGRPLLAQAETSGRAWLTASLVHGPAVVLGASQRAGRVVRLDACAAAGTTVLRRATAGTAVYIDGRALLWTLSLPRVAALAPDATMRTLLNRNVRGFLKGLQRGGALAHYFGREWLSVRHRPAAVIGFETTRSGAVLIEVMAGIDASPMLPEALATDDERRLDRWRGKVPAALGELVDEEPMALAEGVMKAVAHKAGMAMEEGNAISAEPAVEVTHVEDPLPAGFTPGPMRSVPIGWIDTAVDRATGRAWIGGDVLAPRWLLDDVAAGEAEIGEAPLEGASLEDLREARATAAS